MNNDQGVLRRSWAFMASQFSSAPKSLIFLTVASAMSRVLETASLILPVKAVFVMLNPTVLPVFWSAYGFGIGHFMVLIMATSMLVFLASRVLHALARREARRLHQKTSMDDADRKALLTMRLGSSCLVLIVFMLLIGAVFYPALLILSLLLIVSWLVPVRLTQSGNWRFIMRALGATEASARFKLLNSLLFLAFFMSLIAAVLLLELHVGVSLLFAVLVGRRTLQEYARLRIGMESLDDLLAGRRVETGDA